MKKPPTLETLRKRLAAWQLELDRPIPDPCLVAMAPDVIAALEKRIGQMADGQVADGQMSDDAVALVVSAQERADLAMAVQCWLGEYNGAAPAEEIERMERLARLLEEE